MWTYSFEQHGVEQADGYVAKIREQIEALVAAPGRARRLPRWRGYHRLAVEEHFVFVQMRDDGVRVARILHNRMDAPRHLR